jgi:hypothetical protein
MVNIDYDKKAIESERYISHTHCWCASAAARGLQPLPQAPICRIRVGEQVDLLQPQDFVMTCVPR